jgi:hypothetical protein
VLLPAQWRKERRRRRCNNQSGWMMKGSGKRTGGGAGRHEVAARKDAMQQPARTDERQPTKILNRVWYKFKVLLERDKAEFAALRVTESPLLGLGSTGGGGSQKPTTGLEDCNPMGKN